MEMYDLKGMSGASLSTSVLNGHLVIRKEFTSKKGLTSFLEAESALQMFLSQNNLLNAFKQPKMLDVDVQSNTVLMEFVRGRNAVSFLERATTKEIQDFVAAVDQFLRKAIERANRIQLNDILKSKVEELSLTILEDSSFLSKVSRKSLESILNRLSNKEFSGLTGPGHGDFTLENMIFAKDRIFLVDAYKPYIEGASFDAIKLEQDLQDLWFCHNLKIGSRILVRCELVAPHISKKIEPILREANPDYELRRILRLINLIRIIPYAKRDMDKSHLAIKIDKLLKIWV